MLENLWIVCVVSFWKATTFWADRNRRLLLFEEGMWLKWAELISKELSWAHLSLDKKSPDMNTEPFWRCWTEKLILEQFLHFQFWWPCWSSQDSRWMSKKKFLIFVLVRNLLHIISQQMKIFSKIIFVWYILKLVYGYSPYR